jgi:signal transduction histidine kinase
LNQSSQFGPSVGRDVALPVLVECDSRGRVLWISNANPASVDNPKQLLDIIAVTRFRNDVEIPAVRFWKVLDFRESVLIAVFAAARPETAELSTLQANLIQHFYGLLTQERRLFESAQRRRGRSGKRAVRQIERERQRLGRELHTGVGQMLAAIRWQLEVAVTELPSPPDTVRHALDAIGTLTGQALEQVRSISKRLHPPEWQRLSLESALQQLWELSGIPHRLTAALHIEPLPAQPGLEVKVLLYRAFQEALSNLARHSRATRIDAELRVRGARLRLEIRDNGVGFDVRELFARPAHLQSGIGLRSIREMAEAVGANFELVSGENGTTLSISAPFSPDT